MKLLVLLAGLVVGVVTWWVSHEESAGQPMATREPPRPANGAAIERRAVDSRPALTTHPALPTPITDHPDNPPPPDAAESDPEATVAAQRSYLQAHFADQTVDSSWANTARQELNEDLGKIVVDGIRVHGVECRSTLCRAEFIVASQEVGMTFLESWLHQRASTGPGFAAKDETSSDGNTKMILFLGRPGTALPYLE